MLERLGSRRIVGQCADGDRRVAVEAAEEHLRLALVRDLVAQQADDVLQVGAQWKLHRDLRTLRTLDDGRVVDGIRGKFLVRDHSLVSSSARMNV